MSDRFWKAAEEDLGPLPFLRELEGHAHEFLDPPGLSSLLRVVAAQMIDAHSIPVRVVPPVGADGWSTPEGIFVASGLPSRRLEDVLTREVTRWLLFRKGISPPEQDMLLVELSLCWQIPARSCVRLRNAAGDFAGAVRAFVHAYRAVASPAMILIRAAQACDVAMMLFPARSQALDVIPQHTETNLKASDERWRQLVAQARESALPIPGGLGVKAISYRDDDRRGVALVMDRGFRRPETDPAFFEAIRASIRWDAGEDDQAGM